MITIDKLCYNSKLRRVNAGEKCIFSFVTLCMCIISRSLLIAGIVLLVTGILTVGIGGIKLSRYLRLMLIPLAFLLLSTIAILVNFSKVPLDGYAIPIGFVYVTASKEALLGGFRLIATALSAVSCLYFLSLSTPMTDILHALKKIHIPALILELMLLIYRFIFVLLETGSSILTAQKSRLGNKDLKTSLKSFGGMVSVLFIRSMKRSNALYDAMESRCYDGVIRVLTEVYPPKALEIAGIIIFELVLLFITVACKLK